MTVTFTLRNVGDLPVVIQRLVAGARGPNARAQEWNAPNVDFPARTDVVIAPGAEYVYRESRTFSQGGDYFAEPAFLDPDGQWQGIEPYSRVWFDVRTQPPTFTPTPTVTPSPIPTTVPTGSCPNTNAPFIFPLDGRMGWLFQDPRSSGTDPTTCVDGKPCHSGIDIWPELGDTTRAVRAAYAGTVYYKGATSLGIGNDGMGGIRTYYGYINSALRVGNHVNQGDSIGTVALDPYNRMYHLHFSVGCTGCGEQDPYNNYRPVVGTNDYDISPYLGMKVDARRGASMTTWNDSIKNYDEPLGTFCFKPAIGIVLLSEPADSRQVTSPVTFRWPAVAGASRYQVQILKVIPGVGDQINSATQPKMAIETSGSSTQVDLGNGDYSWHVLALDQYGNGIWSTTQRFTVVPQGASVALKSGGAIKQDEQQSVGKIAITEKQPQMQIDLNWTSGQIAMANVPIDTSALALLQTGNSNLELAVFDPSGKSIDEKYLGAKWVREPTHVQLTVQDPMLGNWNVAVIGKQVALESSPYEIVATVSQTKDVNAAAWVLGLVSVLALLFVAGMVVVMTMRQPTAMAALYRVDGRQARLQTLLAKPVLSIGRDSRGSVPIHDPQVSARHAQITRQGNQYVLSDLNSTNGTFVNGERVQQHILCDDDHICIGGTELIFRLRR